MSLCPSVPGTSPSASTVGGPWRVVVGILSSDDDVRFAGFALAQAVTTAGSPRSDMIFLQFGKQLHLLFFLLLR